MPEEISTQILSQASENIQKLFDLSTRIDERVKAIQFQQEILDRRTEELVRRQNDAMQKLAVLEFKVGHDEKSDTLNECENAIIETDKRVTSLERENGRHSDRWNKFAAFVIQLVWVILAAYLLTKLHLQAPAVP